MGIGVTALAALMRFAGLSYPTQLVFDEVFYARGAYSLLTLGYEGAWGGDNQDFANGDFSQLSTEGDYVVHPLVGKQLIGVGMSIFGPNPFGWRFMGALLGTLTVLIVAMIARHLLRSTLWGGVAGVLLAIEGAHIVLSRSALLDIYLTFFVVAGFGLLVVDRAVTRQRIFTAADALREQSGLAPGAVIPGLGPVTGIRWWRFAAIVALSLSVTVKWSGLWFMAAFLILSVAWDWVDRYTAGVERWFAGAYVRAVPAAVLTLIVLPAVYIASWIPWFRSSEAYARQWAQNHPGEGLTWLPESLRSLAEYHRQMWTFHEGLDSEHNYMSNPWTWLFQWRPTAFHFEDAPEAACEVERCVSAIHSVGHPLVWWAGVAALIYAVWRMLRRRDLLALTVSLGVFAGWLPWLMYAHRTIFTFYTAAMSPFVVLTLVWALKRLAQPQWLDGQWSRGGTTAVVGFMTVALFLAAFFTPIWTGQPIPFEYWQLHMWLPSWV